MTEISQLSSFDIFYFYGDANLDPDIEMESEILAGLIQPKRSLFYDRSEGCGITERENYPGALPLQVGVKYDIVNWMAKRNVQVTDGQNGYRDRRAAVSQKTITVGNNAKGEMDIEVKYIPFKDVQSVKTVNTGGLNG
jgi:hypothetical protein